MSMFGIVFPDPSRSDRVSLLLSFLAFDAPDSEAAADYAQPIINLRLRDMWVEKSPDGPVLAVYTRNGGGNREHYDDMPDSGPCTACQGDRATTHPAYLRDEDDDFDSTYRTYWFAFPESLPNEIKEILAEVAEDPRNMSEVWQQAIGRL